MRTYIGIDPGLGGAVAVLNPEGGTARVKDTPVLVRVDAKGRQRRDYALADMRTILQACQSPVNQVLACLEAVHAMPGQGVSSMFAMGRGFGIWQGLLAGLQIPFVLVEPVKWKRAYGLLGRGKDASRLMAQQRWPTLDLSKKKHDGRADALFLADYCQNHVQRPVRNNSERGNDGDRSDRTGDESTRVADPAPEHVTAPDLPDLRA